jgi:hypothetical protein
LIATTAKSPRQRSFSNASTLAMSWVHAISL